MRIGELGQITGVDVETIRYYERTDLLPPPFRQPNGYRPYRAEHLERLAFIRHCRALDLPLAAAHGEACASHVDTGATLSTSGSVRTRR